MASEFLAFLTDHTNMDYPVGVYYIDFSQMFMNHVNWHWHEALELDLVRSGTALFHIGGSHEIVSAGNAILVNGNHIHSIEPGGNEPCIILSILFHPNFLFGSSESFLYTKYCAPLMNNRDFRCLHFTAKTSEGRKCIEKIQAILEANLNPSYGFELTTQSLLCEFWIHLLSVATPQNKSTVFSLQTADEERTKEGMLFLHTSFQEDVSLEDIAKAIHISKSECCRCFKRSIGISPFEYLMQYRVYAAAVQMQRFNPETDSMQSISVNTGFHNASYFNKIFKKYLGTTPSKYRDQIKRNHRDALSPYGIPLSRM